MELFKPQPLKWKIQNRVDCTLSESNCFNFEDIRSAVLWAEHEMLHTNKDKINVLYEAFEDVMKPLKIRS